MEALRKNQRARAKVLKELITEEILPYELVRAKLNISASVLKSLESQEVIRIERESYYRNPVKIEADREQGGRFLLILTREKERPICSTGLPEAEKPRSIYP